MSYNNSQYNGYLKLDNGDIYEGYIFGYRGNNESLYKKNESAGISISNRNGRISRKYN